MKTAAASIHTYPRAAAAAANCWKSDRFWIWKIQVQGSSPIGWNCRNFSLVPFYRIHRIKKEAASDWFLGLIDKFFFGEKRSHWSIWIVAMNSTFLAGKFEFWQEISMLAGRLLRWFQVHHFRWRHFRWCNFRSLPVTSGDATSGDVTAPHCSSSYTVWAVPIHYWRLDPLFQQSWISIN